MEGPQTMVGIATYDSTIHFYCLKLASQQPLMLVVPDVQDVYTPLQSDIIVQLSECRQHLEMLLENIPMMFQNSRISDSAFGAAVKAAFLAMKSTGGKLLVFQSVLPSIGIGALSAREAEGRTNITAGEKEIHKLLQPADKVLTMAIEFAEYQGSLVVMPTCILDLSVSSSVLICSLQLNHMSTLLLSLSFQELREAGCTIIICFLLFLILLSFPMIFSGMSQGLKDLKLLCVLEAAWVFKLRNILETSVSIFLRMLIFLRLTVTRL